MRRRNAGSAGNFLGECRLYPWGNAGCTADVLMECRLCRRRGEGMPAGFYFRHVRFLEEDTCREQDEIRLLVKDPDNLTIHKVVSLYGPGINDRSLLSKAVRSQSLPDDGRSCIRKMLDEMT